MTAKADIVRGRSRRKEVAVGEVVVVEVVAAGAIVIVEAHHQTAVVVAVELSVIWGVDKRSAVGKGEVIDSCMQESWPAPCSEIWH